MFKKLLILLLVFILISPASAKVDITVSPAAINFGSALPDGSTLTFSGTIDTKSNKNIDVYTWASSDLTSGSNIIALNPNFVYNYNNTGSFIPLSTTPTLVIDNWPSDPSGHRPPMAINYKLIVPFGTEPGVYTTTVYTAAVSAGNLAPVSSSESSAVNAMNNTTNNSSNSANTTNDSNATLANTLVILFNNYSFNLPAPLK